MKKLVHGFYHGRKDEKAQRSSMVEKKIAIFPLELSPDFSVEIIIH